MNGQARPGQPQPEDVFEPNFADPPLVQGGVSAGTGSGPVDTRPQPRAGRRLEMLRGSPNREAAVRVTPGQLPTYERAYLVDELRRIFLITAGLLGIIVALTVLLR